jgi:hypothetical protein
MVTIKLSLTFESIKNHGFLFLVAFGSIGKLNFETKWEYANVGDESLKTLY